MSEIKDLAIIGAGPAGMSAAIYTARTGSSVCLFEKFAPGGQAALTDMIDNYPGFEQGIGGMELSDKMRVQAERFDCLFIYDSVESFVYDPQTKIYTIQSGMGTSYQARSILISSGTSSKRLGVLGEDKFFGRGIGTCAVCDGAFYKDKVVAVIGGGNSALEESLYLAKIASKVYIIHRRDQFRAEKITQNRVMENPKIELILDTVVQEFCGDQKLEKLILQNVLSQELSEKQVDGAFVYVGLNANTHFVDDQYKDTNGFINAQDNQVNKFGLFAAGDCCSNSIKQVVVACADGAKASFHIAEYLDLH